VERVTGSPGTRGINPPSGAPHAYPDQYTDQNRTGGRRARPYIRMGNSSAVSV